MMIRTAFHTPDLFLLLLFQVEDTFQLCNNKGIPNKSGVWKFGVKSWGEKVGDK